MKQILLIIHFIGMAMALGASFSSFFVSMTLSKYPKDEAIAMAKKNLVLIYLAKTGLVLLIGTGLKLMMPYMSAMKEMPWFHTKLTLVFLLLINLIVMAIFSKKAKAEGGEKFLPRIKLMSIFSMIFGISIIVCAVMNFRG